MLGMVVSLNGIPRSRCVEEKLRFVCYFLAAKLVNFIAIARLETVRFEFFQREMKFILEVADFSI